MDETAGWPTGEAVPCGYRACPYEHRVSITTMRHIVYKVETEVETDGRWIAEITDLPGVLAYGSTEREAVASAQALALRVLADRIEEEKEPAETGNGVDRSRLTVSQWPSSKAAKVFRALLRKGYTVKSQKGSHVILMPWAAAPGSLPNAPSRDTPRETATSR